MKSTIHSTEWLLLWTRYQNICSFSNDDDLLFPLTFLSQRVGNLYLRLLQQGFITINPKESTDDSSQRLYYGHILLECLMDLSNKSCKGLSTLGALITLLPWLRVHQLENLGSNLLWIYATKDIKLLQ